MTEVKQVSGDLMIRANLAAADGPRGFENAMVSLVRALSKEASPADLLASPTAYKRWPTFSTKRVRALPVSRRALTAYKLINDAALKAAAACPLSMADMVSDIQFDPHKFLELALSFTEVEGNG